MASVAVHRASPPPTPPLEEINRDTPPPDEDRRPPRPSSPDTCPICLDTFDDKKDKAYSDNCYHIFCFECLLEWSNNKRECPLCKRPFKEINHKIKSHTEYEVHRLPPQQPDLDLGRHVPWTNVTWEWMRQMRQQFIHNRQQQLERIRNGTNRHTALRPRNVLRPATTDRRRFIYRYGLYCEGARAPGSGPLRHRRTTPDFYRRNPAQIHRLVPWLNRELVAILSHRDNVQFVLDHILAEIRRVDMRSQQFMESIRPFTLAHTDHFMHEFYQFAMSPMDMASWDTYAQYPPTPRGTLPIPVGEERVTSVTRSNPVPRANPVARANPVSRSNITDPPGDSSSSDSDDEAPRLLLRGTQRPDRPGGLQTLQSNATYHNVAPPTSMLGGRRRMSWHRQRLIAEELGTIDIQPTTSKLFNGRRRSRWESDAANSSSSGAASSPHSSRNTRNTRWDDNSNYQSPADTGSGGASRSAQEEPYLTASQRSAQRRLRRSLNRINNSSLLGRYSSSDLDPDHITTIDLESEPTTSAENSEEPRAAAGYESLVNRVRSFLNTIDDELSNDGVGVTRQSNLSMPMLGELTGEINSDIDVTDMPVPPLPGNSLASTSSGSRMSDNRPFLFDHGMEDSQSLPSLPSLTPARADRPASPSSSHSSDCILVQEEKPYRARTPIMLSDESQDDEEGPIDVLTDIGRKISSADRRLSESSVDYETAGPSSGRKLSPKRRKHKRFASPDLTSSSDNERDARPSHTHSHSSSAPNNPSTSFSASVPTLPRNESSDSDCMVTFQATKPKLLSNLLKHAQREKSERERETKKSKHKKEKRKSKKDKSSDRDMKKRKRKHRSPSDQRHHNEKISRKSPDIDVEGLDDENKHTSPQINIRKKHKKSKRHHQSDSDKDANSHRPRRLQSDASIIGNIGERIMNEPLSESRTSLQSSTGEISPSKPSASVVPNVRSTSSPDNECSSSSGMTYVQTGASSSQPPVSEGDNPQSSRSPNIDIPIRTHNDQQEQQQLTQPNQDAQDAAQIDVRQKIRKFAKEKIASKYHGTNCKKHNRGHKKSSKQALLN